MSRILLRCHPRAAPARREQAVEWGSLDLDTEHLLWAAIQDDLVAAGCPPGRRRSAGIAAQVEEEAEQGGRTTRSLADARGQGALLGAYDEMRELGASYSAPSTSCSRWPRRRVGGRAAPPLGLSHTKLRGAVIRG